MISKRRRADKPLESIKERSLSAGGGVRRRGHQPQCHPICFWSVGMADRVGLTTTLLHAVMHDLTAVVCATVTKTRGLSSKKRGHSADWHLLCAYTGWKVDELRGGHCLTPEKESSAFR
jgi:hypothetical protein